MTRPAAAALAAAAALGAPSAARAEAPGAGAAKVETEGNEARAATPAAPAPARAEPPPDPAVLEAADANLEPIALRRGVIVTLALGGALSIGFGMDNATGRGGAGTLRIGHVANRRTVVGIEVVGSALFFEYGSTLYRTDAAHFLVTGQLYVNPALWLRAGAGLGRYAGEQLEMGGLIIRERVRYLGPAGSVGAGVDLVRLKRFRAGLEVTSTALLNRDGVLSSNAFLLSVALD